MCAVALAALHTPHVDLWDAGLTLSVRAGVRAPELSPHWYLLSEAFLRHLPYFTPLVWAHPLMYPAPCAVKLGVRRPALAVLVPAALAALTDPSRAYTLVRAPAVTALLVALPPADFAARASRRSLLLWGALSLFSLAVSPTLKDAWEHGRVVNANHLFNQQLLFTLAAGAALAEVAGAALRDPLEPLEAAGASLSEVGPKEVGEAQERKGEESVGGHGPAAASTDGSAADSPRSAAAAGASGALLRDAAHAAAAPACECVADAALHAAPREPPVEQA